MDAHQLDLSLWLHRRLTGIVYKEKNDPNLHHEIYTIQDHEKGYERIEETPEYPSSKDINS